MKTSSVALAAGLVLALHPGAALAQDREEPALPPAERRPDTSFSVGEILVTARGMASSAENVLTSVDRLGGDVAQASDVSNVFELVARMPGVQLTEFYQGTTSGKFSFRGFNGEGNINAVKLLIDGIPSNSNDGNMPFIDMVFPLDVETIEVVRGTADPRWGLHNIAGNVNIVTRSGGTFVDGRASLGSYDTYQAQAVAGIERGALSQTYQAAWRQSDGFRDHARNERLSLSGKWALEPASGIQLCAIARYYEGDAQEPGYLTFADSRADRRMTNAYNATDGGTRDMQQYALTLDAALSDRLDFTSLAYHNRLRDDRYVKFSAQTSQQRRLTEEDQYGLTGALHWHVVPGGVPVMLEAGGDVQWQDNRSRRWLAVERVPTQQTRDQQFDMSVAGAYLQATVEPAEWLRITPAYRLDWVGGHFDDRLSGTPAPINDYGTIEQPKLSVALLPTDNITIYASYGRTFQIGLASGAYLIPPRQLDLAPSINEGWEAGVSYRQGRLLEARLAYWEQSATGEIARRLNDPLGDSENVGGTDRRGVDLQLSLRPLERLSLWGAVAWQEARITTSDPATPQFAGNEIDHTPHWLWSGGVEFAPFEGLALSLTGRGQSSYHLTSANAEGRWGGMASFDLSAEWQVAERVELGLAVHNLTADDVEYVWWDGIQTLHAPGEGRNVAASVRVRFP